MKSIISFLLRNVPRKYLQMFSHRILAVVAIFYYGKKVECAVCKWTYRKFLPYGRLKPRKNALCPNCLSLERHRLLWLFLKDKTDFFSQKLRVLHVAPELCFITRFEKMDNLEYVTGDLDSPLAKVKMDLQQIPFENNNFDVVFCNHVMEHVNNDLQAMTEIHRILKPAGWAIIQVPFFYPIPEKTFEDPSIKSHREREEAYGQDDHVRKYGKDFADRLRSAGFKVAVNDYTSGMDQAVIEKFGLPAAEEIFVCSK